MFTQHQQQQVQHQPPGATADSAEKCFSSAIVILVIASSSHPEEAISCFAGKSRIVAIRDLQREKLKPHKNVKF